MKKINFYTNFIFLVITLLIYCKDVSNGLFAQLYLGGFQLLCALIITIFAFRNELIKLQRLLAYYWIAVIAYVLFSQIKSSNNHTNEIVFIAIPLSIAAYFVYITHFTQKQKP